LKGGVVAIAVVFLLSGCTGMPGAGKSSAPESAAASIGVTAVPHPARRHRALLHSALLQPARDRLRLAWLPGRLPQPLAREAVISGAAPSHAVIAGGLVAGDTSTRATYRLDLRTGHSTRLPNLPTAVHDTAGSLASGHALVIGGGNAMEQSVVQARGARGWRVIGHLPSPRSDLTAVSSSGTTYVVGGYDGTTPAMADVLRSRDGRGWTTVAELPVPVRYAATVLVGTSLWVFGGEVAGTMVHVVQHIDLRTGRASVAHHLPVPLGHSVAIRLGGRVLLIGGRTTAGRTTSRMWWFRPDTARFTAAGRLPTPLADAGAVTAGRTAYLVGGERPALSDRVLRLRWG
jgi:hypothetical protein